MMTFFWQQGGKLFEQLLAMAIGLIVARLLGPKLYGYYNVIGNLPGLLVALVALGYEDSLTNFLGRYTDRPGVVSYLLREVIKRRIVYTGVAMGVLALFAGQIAVWQGFVTYETEFRLVAVICFLMAVANLLTMSLIALFDVKANTLLRTLSLALQLVLAYKLIKSGYGLQGAIYAWLIGVAVLAFGLSFQVFQRTKHPPEHVELRPVLRFGIGLWINSVVGVMIGKQLGVMMLSQSIFGIDKAHIGYFNAAFNGRMFADSLLLAGMSGTALAAAARLAERKGKDGLAIAWRLNVRLTTMLAVPSMLFFTFQGYRSLTLIFGRDFGPAFAPFLWMMGFQLLMRIYGGGASSTVMSAGGKVRLVVQQYMISGAISIVLVLASLIVFARVGQMEAVVAVCIALGVSNVLLSFLGFRVVKRSYHVMFPTLFTIKVVLAGGLAGASTLWLPFGNWDNIHFLPQLCIVAGLAIQFTLVFYGLMRILRPLSAEDYDVAVRASNRVSRFLRPMVGEPILDTLPREEPVTEKQIEEAEGMTDVELP